MRRHLVLATIAITAGGMLLSVPGAQAGPGTDPAGNADTVLAANPAAFRTSANDRYASYHSTVDRDGAAHVRYTRTYKDLPVRGGDVVVHVTPAGKFGGASVGLAKPLGLDTKAKISATAAANAARSRFTGTVASVGTPRLIVDATSGNGQLAWETVVAGMKPDAQTPSKLHVLTDASRGSHISSWDEIVSVAGTGNSLYAGTVTIDTTLSGSFLMQDPSHGNNTACDMNNGSATCTQFTDADNVWGDGSTANRQTAAVDAYFGAAQTFDYFKNVHARNGIFGDGRGVPSRVHYGNAYVNAFWDGAQMTYGDGASNLRPLVSLDVAGHEMSHGVTENVVPGGLTYSGESGGLNEATSDIFGNMVEFYANTAADPGDYQVGEKININGNGTPLRYMYNPVLDGLSDSCWTTNTKNKDVHYSSGVGNHFFFDLAEGTGATAYGTSPVCGTAAAVTGIGRAKAEKIWFRALDIYFTSSTSYVNTTTPANTARAYTLQAATDLYGSCSLEYRTVQAAWTAVAVTGSDATCTDDFSMSVSPSAGSVLPGGSVSATVATAVTSGVAQTVTFSASGLPAGATATFNPPSVTAGGSSTVTIGTATSTPAGAFLITLTGTGTTVTRSTSYTLTVGGCSTPGQLLGNPGFETGTAAPWTSTPNVVRSDYREPAHSGSWDAWLGGKGYAFSDTLAQAVTLPAGCTTYAFSFWLHIDTAEYTGSLAYDTFRVQVLNSAGTVLATLATYSNLNMNTGYALKSFNLAGYAGQSITLRFASTEDAYLATSFVVDDTALTVS